MNHINSSKLLYAKDWDTDPHKNIAELFFYSLSYNNTELINKCLMDWQHNGRNINSLFYIIETYVPFGGYSYGNASEKTQLELCFTDSVGLKINSVKWGQMNPNIIMQFQQLGLELPTGIANEIFLHALGAKNTHLMTFLLPYISFDKNPRFKTKLETDNGINHSFIDGPRLMNSIGRNLARHFDEVFVNEVIGYFPIHTKDLYIRMYGWACSLKNDETLQYFMRKPDFLDRLSDTENFINNNPNNFLLQTKNGAIGNDSDVLSYLNKISIFSFLENKIPQKNFEHSKNKLKI